MDDINLFEDLRILLVHRDQETRDRIKRLLREAGCDRIKDVEDDRGAVEALLAGPFEVAITEVRIESRGWGLVRLIRCGRFCEPTLPIVAIHDGPSNTAAQAEALEYCIAVLPSRELEWLVETVNAVLGGHAKPRVLVIEDDARMAEFIKQSLHDRYRVDVACDGEVGLDAWKAERHALLVLDIMLPGLTGGEVLVQILAIDKAQPVIVLTAYGTQERHVDLMLKGAAEFMQKPVSMEALRWVCGSVLRRRRYRALSTEIERSEAALNHLSHCTEMADQLLTSGQIWRASFEIKRGLTACRKRSSTDREGDSNG